MSIPKVCQLCGTEFIAKKTVTKFCSTLCAQRAYKKRKREEKIKQVEPVATQKLEYNQEQIKNKDFLSINEACKLLGASRMTLYRQIKSGNIRAAKLGRRTIIKRDEIDKLFAS